MRITRSRRDGKAAPAWVAIHVMFGYFSTVPERTRSMMVRVLSKRNSMLGGG